MNTKQDAIADIEEFLKSDDRCILITGTHQYKKHILTMSLLNKYYANEKILFRSNGIEYAFSTPDILGNITKKRHKAGEKFYINKNIYTVDSFNSRTTWYKTGNNNRFAIVYPIDAIIDNRASIDGITELFGRDIKKIFLITWTDHRNHDYSQLEGYIDKRTIYDVEEEDLDYHKRVLECF